MGNYLLSLRVPPPTPEEDERNHPDYYDWSIPKWYPFKRESPPVEEKVKTLATTAGETIKGITSKPRDTVAKTLSKVASEPTSEIATTANKSIKETLTGTWSDRKPANFKSKLPRPTESHKTDSSSSGKSAGGGKAVKIDITKPHTVDTKKYGDTETAASIKSTSNIHAPVAKKT